MWLYVNLIVCAKAMSLSEITVRLIYCEMHSTQKTNQCFLWPLAVCFVFWRACLRHMWPHPGLALSRGDACSAGHAITISPVVHGVTGAFISCIMAASSTGHGENSMFYLVALPPSLCNGNKTCPSPRLLPQMMCIWIHLMRSVFYFFFSHASHFTSFLFDTAQRRSRLKMLIS